ncbi:permease prefix domain 1-containing protein [Demequina sp.]|uniref:permease prefix domain 1-containing protein n=1 Tax=Demequina sp. TaxID=2050685 RepID=UPI003A875E4D
MNVIIAYLDTMFSAYPTTPQMSEAKTELRGMMEDAYTSLIAQGHTENEAVGQVIRDFGNLEEVAPALGITSVITADAPAGSSAAPARRTPALPPLTLGDAQDFAQAQRRSTRRVTVAVALFILSPVTIMVASEAQEVGLLAWSEGAVELLGVLTILVFVAAGVLLCISAPWNTAALRKINEGEFSISPEVTAWADALVAAHERKRTRALQVAITMWILAVTPILALSIPTEGTAYGEFWSTLGVALTLAMVAGGLGIFLPTTWASTVADKLNAGEDQDEDDEDDGSNLIGVIAAFYWPLLTAGFLAWSFIGNAWHISWIVWPIGAVLFGAIAGGISALAGYRNSRG